MSTDMQTAPDQERIFERLFKEEYSGLVRYAVSLLRRQSSGDSCVTKAEEAVQEMFALAWDKREALFQSEKPVGWLYKALFYKIKELMNEERKWSARLEEVQKTHIGYREDAVNPDIEFHGIVTESEFDLLKKLYIEGYSYKELCEMTGLQKSALGMKVNRIKARIRAELEEVT